MSPDQFKATRVFSTLDKALIFTPSVDTFQGDNESNLNGTQMRFGSPSGLAADSSFLYVSDTSQHSIRAVALNGSAVREL